MIVESLWIKRIGWDSPEILEAWDEVSVDENLDGFNEACADAIAKVGDEVEAVRYITIQVSSDALAKAFENTYVESAVIDFREGVAGGTK